MSANTTPIFPLTPQSKWVTVVSAANTAMDGTGTVYTVITAGAAGTFASSVIFRPTGSNSTAMTARIFINNGSTNATAANNALIGEMTLPSTTLSQTAAMPHYEYPINRMLPAGYQINVCFGTAPSVGMVPSGFSADY